MTVDKAVELLKAVPPTIFSKFDSDYYDAVQLGIEALRRTKKEREIKGGLYNYLLPGETEE